MAVVIESAAAYAGAIAGAGGRALESLQRAGAALAVVLYASPAYDVQVPALEVSRLSINLTPSRVDGALDGDRRRAWATPRHSLFLTPAGAAAHWHKATPSRHINIYFHADDDGRPPAPLLNGRLPGATPLFDALAQELAGGDGFADEAADSLARLILVRLARQQQAETARRQVLSPAQLQRLRDFVQAHLEQKLLVADLAAVVGLPGGRFAQAFVAQTGLSPHQFVLQQRLARAQALLLRSRTPLAEVAACCGFASQQHLNALMRSRLGTTPGRLRAAPVQS